jgi:IS605 OrfB family transposase
MVNAGKSNSFAIQLRKNTKAREYVRGFCTFKYMDGLLANSLIKNDHGVTYRIVFRGRKCYLQAMVTLDKETNDCKTRSSYGTIGLDYNDGFIELAETNETGNLVYLEHFDLKIHGTGDSATSEIRDITSRIVNYALLTGKDIVIEDLDFRKTKSETDEAKSADGKEYNKMIHAFDYSRYKTSFENCCFRRDVNLIKVNPAYTSKIAKQKYCDSKKLVIHQGASFVIARKGQGYVDKYIKPKKRKSEEPA